MNPFTTVQRKKALVWLSLFHLLVITSSNYLVQLPISIFGFHTTWGAFSFPFIFLATDLTVRIFGAPLARRIIFAVMVPALAISYGISALFYMGEWQGFAALGTFNLFVARIAVASFMAYALGRSSTFTSLTACGRAAAGGWPYRLDAVRQHQRYRGVFLYRFLAQPGPVYGRPLGEIALVDYSFKVLISIIFFLPMYGVLLNMLLKRLADKSDLSALQPS